MEERLQKLLSAAGVCSRRAAEAYITAGRVTVNGAPAVLGQRADASRDSILVDGKPLPRREGKVFLMLNKPRGYVTTLSDERGRRTAAELVRGCGARVYPVGRLDMDSEGLLLFTNDGELSQRLTHPKNGVEKIYHVTVSPRSGNFLGNAVGKLGNLRVLDGEEIRPAQVEVLRRTEETAVLSVAIRQGKNRQIRRMCEACGLDVGRLRRVKEHTIMLGDLKPGRWRYLTEAEIAALKGEAPRKRTER